MQYYAMGLDTTWQHFPGEKARVLAVITSSLNKAAAVLFYYSISCVRLHHLHIKLQTCRGRSEICFALHCMCSRTECFTVTQQEVKCLGLLVLKLQKPPFSLSYHRPGQQWRSWQWLQSGRTTVWEYLATFTRTEMVTSSFLLVSHQSEAA